ncbi:hypothetical protein L6452_14272 [Arctium lappa]|uniref:Uncharacterized protein n=1 Tax=Arctium lappa TaxID=4217 RepID=A0ACB9CKU6_ARCLA|nr:hypothetical protein L6452_14272 [Arctium lappa]
MHPKRVRKPSQRISLNTAFSTFTNTADDPVLLDEDDSNDSPVTVRVNEDHRLRRVRNRVIEDNGSSPLSHEGNGSASVVELGTNASMSSRRDRKRKGNLLNQVHFL